MNKRVHSSNPFKKRGDGGVQFLGNRQHGGECEIRLAPLDLSHVAAVDVANVRELLL